MQNEPSHSEFRLAGLWQSLGGTFDCRIFARILLRRYDEPHRAYHNLDHITECLEELDDISDPNFQPVFPKLMELAIWYHDAVYDTKRKDNEEQSSKLCLFDCQNLDLPLAEEISKHLHHLIMATKHSDPPLDLDGQIIVDIDLARLGYPPEHFLKFGDQIAFEFSEKHSGYTADQYRIGRKKFLVSMLNRDRIYHTDYFFNKYETQARINLAEGIRRLNAP